MIAVRINATGSWRWKICALLFFATSINYMDRQLPGLRCWIARHDRRTDSDGIFRIQRIHFGNDWQPLGFIRDGILSLFGRVGNH
jgi:hypothetical protein